jgi:hypothetical protein
MYAAQLRKTPGGALGAVANRQLWDRSHHSRNGCVVAPWAQIHASALSLTSRYNPILILSCPAGSVVARADSVCSFWGRLYLFYVDLFSSHLDIATKIPWLWVVPLLWVLYLHLHR